jgi:nicotinate-nucleotide--dimethylbenzimidazole phosphoribosyltransferase
MSSRSFHISPRSTEQRLALQQKIDQKTKPLRALGKLEGLAQQLGEIQNTLEPELSRPTLLICAGDHGIAQAGVSAYPAEVTSQMVHNFLDGGAAVNVFCRQLGWDYLVVDAGVNHEFARHHKLINAKLGAGTRNALEEPAMSRTQCDFAIDQGAALVQSLHETGCNVLGLGEMGIGNTSAASLLMSRLCDLPLAECVGRGTGLDEAGVQRKTQILQRALDQHAEVAEPLDVLATFGGFEMATLCGACLAAAALQMTIVVDGFIVTSALLPAFQLFPQALEYCVFAHQSHEAGHARLLAQLGVTPLLHLDLALGEGAGAALALPLLEASVAFLREMASFASAGVSTAS